MTPRGSVYSVEEGCADNEFQCVVKGSNNSTSIELGAATNSEIPQVSTRQVF